MLCASNVIKRVNADQPFPRIASLDMMVILQYWQLSKPVEFSPFEIPTKYSSTMNSCNTIQVKVFTSKYLLKWNKKNSIDTV